jgi:hypothetical protein
MQCYRVPAVNQAWRRMIRFGECLIREGGSNEMTNMSDSSGAPDDSQKPPKPLRPKRGAFPTPKSEIDKAQPYIPAPDEESDKEGKDEEDLAGESEEGEQEEGSDIPTDVDGEQEG